MKLKVERYQGWMDLNLVFEEMWYDGVAILPETVNECFHGTVPVDEHVSSTLMLLKTFQKPGWFMAENVRLFQLT